MAIDTSRARLARIARRRGDDVGQWAETWADAKSSTRYTQSIDRQRRRRARRASLVLVALAVGAYFAAPSGVGGKLSGALRELWIAAGPGCEEVDVRYSHAVRSLGSSGAASNATSFRSASDGCLAAAAGMASKSRATACQAAVRHFAAALDRRSTLSSIAALQTPGDGVIGVSAAGITGADDVEQLESRARETMADCL